MNEEEAIKILKAIRVYNCYPESSGKAIKEAINTAIKALSNNIEIVRCKDCKYGDEDYPKDIFPDITEETYSCERSTYSHDKDFYCKYGKRRDDTE